MGDRRVLPGFEVAETKGRVRVARQTAMAAPEAAGRAERVTGVGRRATSVQRQDLGKNPGRPSGGAPPDTAPGARQAAGAHHLRRDPSGLPTRVGAAAEPFDRARANGLRVPGPVITPAEVQAPVRTGRRLAELATAGVRTTAGVAMREVVGETASGAFGSKLPSGVGATPVIRARGEGVATPRVQLQRPTLGTPRPAPA